MNMQAPVDEDGPSTKKRKKPSGGDDGEEVRHQAFVMFTPSIVPLSSCQKGKHF